MNERRVMIAIAVLLAASILAEFLIPHHGKFASVDFPGFYALCALLGSVLVAAIASLLARVIRRKRPSNDFVRTDLPPGSAES